ncbi:MAG TPA: hypothetical protein VFD82_23970 [Planctomycetota bacterium]|nr:hypothetical protein [Planctomycetota bacterium]
MTSPAEHNRLQILMNRLHDLELRIGLPHERAILEVARTALQHEISALAHRIGEEDYWRYAHVRLTACNVR